MLAQRVHLEGKREGVPFRRALTALAALVFPIVALLTALAYFVFNRAGGTCGDPAWSRDMLEYYRAEHCAGATNPGAAWLALPFAIAILSLIYWRVRVSNPVGRALTFLVAVAAAFAAEFVAGGMILVASLSADGGGYGGLAVYLILAAVASGIVIVKYGRGIRRVSEARSDDAAAIAVPPGSPLPPGPPMPSGPPMPPGPPSPPTP